MEKTTKILWLVFGIIILVKLILALFVTSPSIFSDEYFYSQMGKNIIESGSITMHQEPTNAYPPLYPIIISIAYLFNSISTSYLVIKIINILLSSAIIFPTFFLAKEFLNKKQALLTSITVGIIPMTFAFSPYIMSENLFYTLFITTIYFMYKSLTTNKPFWHIATGVFIALSTLTRIIGLTLIPIYATATIITAIKENKKQVIFKAGILAAIACFLVLLPWIIRNITIFGPTISSILGSYQGELTTTAKSTNNLFLSLILWIIFYIGLLIISSAVIFPAAIQKAMQQTNKKLKTFITIFFSAIIWIILSAANHAARSVIKGPFSWLPGRPIGRYIDVVIPLIIILGYIGLTTINKKDKTIAKSMIIFIPFLALASTLTVFKLFPVNNISTSWMGALSYITSTNFQQPSILVLTILILIPLAIFLINRVITLNNKTIITLILLALLSTSLLSYGITIEKSSEWYNTEQAELGRWIEENIPKEQTIEIDSKDCKSIDLRDIGALCNTKQDITAIGFWIRNQVKIEQEGDIFISTQDYPLDKIKQTEHFKVYQKEQ